MADFDVNKLSRGEQIIGVSAIVLFIFSFFSWYSVDFGGGVDIPGVDTTASANGWDVTLGWLAVIIGLVMLAQILASKFGNVNMPDLGSVTWGQVHLGLGAIALLFLIIKLIDVPDGVDRKIGLFVSLVAAAGLAVGGYLKFQEEKGGITRAPGGPGPGPTA
jgi:hypothetical protein